LIWIVDVSVVAVFDRYSRHVSFGHLLHTHAHASVHTCVHAPVSLATFSANTSIALSAFATRTTLLVFSNSLTAYTFVAVVQSGRGGGTHQCADADDDEKAKSMVCVSAQSV
jgi:hypothetical protein